MNCNELLDCIGQVQDSYIAGSVPAEKPRRKSRRAVYWAAAAVLAVVLYVAGAALFSGGVPVDPNGPMAGGEYDVFSDPNVLWGKDETYNIPHYIRPGTVVLSDGVRDLMERASEEQLIVFRVFYGNTSDTLLFDIDREMLVIHEELRDDGVLEKLIDRYVESTEIEERQELYTQIYSYVNFFKYEERCRALQVMNRLEESRGEDYYKAVAIYEHYESICGSFIDSWELQCANVIREKFTNWGLDPVYENTMENISEGFAMVFMGSVGEIQTLIKKVEETTDVYILTCQTMEEEEGGSLNIIY